VHDRIMSLRGEVWSHKASLNPPLLIEVPVSSVRSCNFKLMGIAFASFQILIFDFGTVLTGWYFMFFILLYRQA
jgi:hypothetical protein